MGQWAWSGRMGALLGSVAFVVVLTPILVWQYRRYGRLSGRRILGAAALSIYVTSLVTYTWLPLPPRSAQWCAEYGVQGVQLHPFAFGDEVLDAAEQLGWSHALRSTVVLQVVFNVVLFIPWGVIVRRYLQHSILVCIVSGALASLLIEVTQATGLWFVYPCAYRVADIGDVIANTTGAAIGALLGPALLFWMPRRELVSEGRLRPRPVTTWRRVMSMAVTAGSVWLVTFVSLVLVRVVLLGIGQEVPSPTTDVLDRVIAAFVVFAVVYVPAAQGNGNIGMHVAWLAPRWRDGTGRLGPGTLWQRLARASVLGLPLLGQAVFPGSAFDTVVLVLALLSLVLVPGTTTHRSLSGLLTRDELVDVRSESAHLVGLTG